MTGGSRQLRQFRIAIRDGKTLMTACVLSGLSLDEGRLTLKADAADPPPPEAFEPISKPMETSMPQDGVISGEYVRPDAEGAFRIYDNEIKAKKAIIAEKSGDLSEPYSRIKDSCHFPRKILDFIVHLEEQEDAKRDHLLLALSSGLKCRKLFMPRDLVTIADEDDGAEIVPQGDTVKPELATLAH